MFKNVRFYINVNKLITIGVGLVCLALYLNYCKKTGKNPIDPVVYVMTTSQK